MLKFLSGKILLRGCGVCAQVTRTFPVPGVAWVAQEGAGRV